MQKKTLFLLSWLLIFTLAFGTVGGSSFSMTALADEITVETEGKGIKINKTNFPSLYKTLKTNYFDLDMNGYLSDSEIGQITTLFVETSISNLKGLEHLTSLQSLLLKEYSGKTLTITKANKALKELYVKPTSKSFTVNAPYLRSLYLTPIALYYVTRSGETWVEGSFEPTKGGIETATTSVNISKCKNLKSFWLSIKTATSIKWPSADDNKIKALTINFWDGKSLSLSSLKKLEYLALDNCSKLTKLDTSKNTKLTSISIEASSRLASVNFKKNKNLKLVFIGDIAQKKYNFSTCSKIQVVLIHDFVDPGKRSVTMPSGKKSKCFIRSKNPRRYRQETAKYTKSGFPVDSLTFEWAYPSSYSVKRPGYELFFDYTLESEKVVKLTKKNFPGLYDSLTSFDGNKNGWLEKHELDPVTALHVNYKISNLKGLHYFTKLRRLILDNYSGTKLSLTDNELLTTLELTATGKKLTINAPKLLNMKVNTSKATSLDASSCKKVMHFSLYDQGKLTTLKLPSSGKALKKLFIAGASISTLNLNSYTKLEFIELQDLKNLKSLSLTKNTSLRALELMDNNIKTLTFGNNKKLEAFYVYRNANISIKNPKKISLPKDIDRRRCWYVEWSISM